MIQVPCNVKTVEKIDAEGVFSSKGTIGSSKKYPPAFSRRFSLDCRKDIMIKKLFCAISAKR